MKKNQIHAILLAILAAVFYAISTPVSKLLLAQATPVMAASLLYLGAGLGIGLLYLPRKREENKGERLNRTDFPFTTGMIFLDIIAAILMMNGVARTTAENASLLTNFEIAATSAIAFFIFGEKISKRMWAALFFITLSSLVLSFEGAESLHFSAGSLMVTGAAVCWGLENNCTKEISSKSTYEIVTLKGLCSGTVMLIIALLNGEKLPSAGPAAGLLLLGFVSYGLSIFTYIRAQKVLGAAKTSAFYALSPFIGTLLSFLLLKEGLSERYLAGLIIMILGSLAAVNDTLGYSRKMPNHIDKK